MTWPKTRPLTDYVYELARAKREGLVINYRVANLPPWPENAFDYGAPEVRCYMVHDGAIRGWCKVLYACTREEGEVDGWPAGLYIVRDPMFFVCKEIPMRGFRGWRWFSRALVA